MNYKRIGRTLICLLLVCVLLVNISPLKAEASALVGGLYAGVSIVVAVSAALNALGIRSGPDPIGFEDLTYTICEELDDKWAYNGLVDVFFPSPNMDRTYVLRDFLTDVLRLLVEIGFITHRTLSESFSFTWRGNDYAFTSDTAFSAIVVQKGQISSTQLIYNVVLLADSPCVVNSGLAGNPQNFTLSEYEKGFYYCYAGLGQYSPFMVYAPNDSAVNTNLPIYHIPWDSSDSLPYLGRGSSEYFWMETVGTDFDSDYAPYAGSAVADEEGVPWIPLTIPGVSPDVFIDQEQEQAQAGSTPQEVIDQLIGTETPPDSGDSNLPQGIGSILATIVTLLTGMKVSTDFLPSVAEGIASFPAKLWSLAPSWLTEGIVNLSVKLDGIGEIISSLPQSIADSVSVFFADVVSAVRAIPQAITDTITAIFVPSADFVSAKVEAVRAKFPFADSIIVTGQAIGGAITGFYTEPPIIYAELSNATGEYYWGDRAVILDLRWYAEYKPTVDILISAFLWAVFCWRIFLKIPGIISGMPGDFVMDAVHHIGVTEALPSRKAAYEVQRQSNRELIRRGKK